MIITAIPARLGSTRLANKLVLTDTGRPLLYHTIDRVLGSKLTSVVFVVTPDKEIENLVRDYGNPKVQVVRTGPAKSGTERIANFVSTYFVDDDHVVVNFQGDEPDLPGHHIDSLAESVKAGFCDVATLASPTEDSAVARDPDVVKVVLDHASNALWFSRQAIPTGGPWLKHVGIYAYSPKFLRRLFLMKPTTAGGECLEQLQWLQAGYRVKVLIDHVDFVGINNHEDYAKFVTRHKEQQCQLVSATS
jgi:3-deoxy-manno-octulosonate cytidylyltransferase (CMP-KDO synthetase)